MRRLLAVAVILVAVGIAFAAGRTEARSGRTSPLRAHADVANLRVGETYASRVSALVDDVVRVRVSLGPSKTPSQLTIKYDNSKPTIRLTVSIAPDGTTDATTASVLIDTELKGIGLHAERSETTADAPIAVSTLNAALPSSTSGPVTLPPHDNTAGIGFDLRLQAAAISVQNFVRIRNTNNWKTEITATPTQPLQYLIRFRNEGNVALTHVAVGDNFPPYIAYVPGSTRLTTTEHPHAVVMSDNIWTGGIDVGTFPPGTGGEVVLDVLLAGMPPGEHGLQNVAVVRADETNEIYNTSLAHVFVPGVVVSRATGDPLIPSNLVLVLFALLTAGAVFVGWWIGDARSGVALGVVTAVLCYGCWRLGVGGALPLAEAVIAIASFVVGLVVAGYRRRTRVS